MPHATPALETHEEVMFFDTDCGGVVSNIAYERYSALSWLCELTAEWESIRIDR